MTEELRPLIRRSQFLRLGAALGVGAASAALAACGGPEEGGSGGGTGNGTSDETTGGGSAAGEVEETTTATEEGPQEQEEPAPTGEAIATAEDVSEGSAVAFTDDGNDAVLVRLDGGDFVAYSAVCTHQGCTVAYRDAQLVCPCHGSIFDPAAGASVLAGPAQAPLPEIPVEVRDGGVYKA